MTDAGEDNRDEPPAETISGGGTPAGGGTAGAPPEGTPSQPGAVQAEPATIETDKPEPIDAEPVRAEPVGAEPAAGPVTAEPRAVDAITAQTPTLSTEPVVTRTAPMQRTGPEVLAEDSWDIVSPASTRQTYEGRRRAGTPSARRWMVLSAVLVGLATAVAVPFALVASRDTISVGPAPTAPPVVRSTTTAAATSTGEAMSVSSTPSPSTTRPRATTTAPTTLATSDGPPPFVPLTLEAENGALSGSADNEPYANASGGRIVMRIGDWNSDPSDPSGTLTISNIVIPADGNYRITIHYVHPNDDRVRRAIITVSGAPPTEQTFIGDNDCCHTKDITLALTAGARTLTITHPTTRGPSVDKIVIRRP